MASPVIYPLFQKCKEYSLDPFWKDIFDGCANNRFPKGLKYDADKNSIIYKSKYIPLPVDDAVGSFKIMIDLFINKLGLVSSRNLIFSNSEENHLDADSWKKIKPKAIKDQLILNYISDLRAKYSLSDIEVKKLFAQIQLGIQFHSIQNDDIIYDEKTIKHIKNLTFSEKRRVFTLKTNGEFKSSEKQPNVTSKFYQIFDKYMRDNRTRNDKLEN
jgi:hypothetical protein